MRSAINIVILLLLPLCAYSQFGLDSLTLAGQRNKFLPTGVRAGTDALALIVTKYNDSFSGWELNADVDFSRYYLAVDYGTWQRMYPGDSSDYANDGRYWRVGVDVNFLTKDREKNMFFFGARYGRSVFSESFRLIDKHPDWGLLDRTFVNDDVHARWFELTTGLRVRMWKFIWMGYTARFKFALHTGDTPELLPHDVPGYGRTDKNSYWGFNYQVFIRIPVRKQPAFVMPVKKERKRSS